MKRIGINMKLFSDLFSSVYIGGLKLKNRIIMAPMLVGYGHLDGSVSDAVVNYYEARAKGGAGLIIVEAACVDSPSGREGFGQLNIDHERYVEGLAALAGSIKKHGARAFIQLFHAGRQTTSSITGEQPVAPSSVACRIIRELPRQLDIDEVKEMEIKFIKAAALAKMAGFEGVEIHAGHGYLINEFLSGHSNQRTDIYGGKLENRMRILLNIAAGIKESIPDLALSVRLNIDDFVPGGLELEESITICEHLEKAGADLLNCTCGTYESGVKSIEPVSYPEGWRIYLAEEVKKAVSIPVAGGGMISSPEYASELIQKGSCDLVFLGRSLLADPGWPDKAREGRVKDIRPCIRCNQCIGVHFQGLPVSCTVNPQAGREMQFSYIKKNAPAKHRAAVIGCGPAGMQTAVSLSRMGVEVIIYEKKKQAGGLMNLAAIPPHKQRVAWLRDYMISQLNSSRVEKVFNHEFTADDLQDIKPDCIVLATGSTPLLPDIEGIENSRCCQMEKILNGSIQIEGQQVLIIGGGENGCETADFLLGSGNRITIIEQGSTLAPGMEKKNRRDLINRLDAGEVKKMTSCQVIKIDDRYVWVKGSDNTQEVITADVIVLAAGYKPYHPMYSELITFNDDLYVIGDALRVRGFKSAMLEGEMTAQIIGKKFGIIMPSIQGEV